MDLTKSKEFLSKNSPTILMATGIVGFASAVFYTTKVAPKVSYNIGVAKLEHADKKEIAKCYLPYLPIVGIMGLSTFAIVKGHKIETGRSVALAGSVALADAALKEYKDKVMDMLGEEKKQEIEKEIAKDHIDKNPPSSSVIVGDGDVLCYDDFSGRYFRTDLNTLKRIENEINRDMMTECVWSVNELYDLIGLEHIPLGDSRGFDINKELLTFSYDAKVSEDGKPCIVLRYPTYELKGRIW